MSQHTVYQTLLADTIKDIVVNKKLTMDEIMEQVMDSLMLAERDVFLANAKANKGNGYYPRFINSLQGKLLLQVPRDRLGDFHPLVLEIIKQDSARLQDLALTLYSQGVSHRGVKQVFESVFATQVSPSKLSQLVKAFEPHRQAWQTRPLEDSYHVILIDAIHHAVRRGTVASEAVYVVMGLKRDFTREILGLYLLPHESAAGWESVFSDLRDRGVKQVGLVLCDELSGIEHAIKSQLPHVHVQLCLVHKVRRLLLRARHQDKAALVSDWRDVLGLDEPEHNVDTFCQRMEAFIDTWATKYPGIKRQLPSHKWCYYSAYLHYPFALRRMLYTTNWVERLNKAIRKVTHHVNSFPSPDSALNLVFMVSKQMEDKTYAKPITRFYPYQQQMERIFDETQTHKY